MSTIEELTERAAALRAQAETPTPQQQAAAKLQQVEQDLAAAQHGVEVDGAKRRLIGVSRAIGSLEAELAEDVEAVKDALAVATADIERTNARFAKLGDLHNEARHLSLDYGLPLPPLRPLTPPGLRDIATVLPRLTARQPKMTPSPKQQTALDAAKQAEAARREASMREALGGLARDGWLGAADKIKTLPKDVPVQSVG